MSRRDNIKFLSQQWRASGVESGDVLLVHSSIGRILKKAKSELDPLIGPSEILESLIKAVSGEGTLLFPLFNFDFAKGASFDIRSTPSQMGVLTEQARLYPDCVRTGHPIYSFAVIGKRRAEFQDIDNFSGYGGDSPFAKLMELDGRIAIIDLTDQNSMTSYHFVEEANQVEYRYHKAFRGLYTGRDGLTNEKEYGLFVRKIDDGVVTDVDRMMNKLWEDKVYKGFLPGKEYGMRTIKFKEFYAEVDRVIKEGKAINYLYSKKKP